MGRPSLRLSRAARSSGLSTLHHRLAPPLLGRRLPPNQRAASAARSSLLSRLHHPASPTPPPPPLLTTRDTRLSSGSRLAAPRSSAPPTRGARLARGMRMASIRAAAAGCGLLHSRRAHARCCSEACLEGALGCGVECRVARSLLHHEPHRLDPCQHHATPPAAPTFTATGSTPSSSRSGPPSFPPGSTAPTTPASPAPAPSTTTPLLHPLLAPPRPACSTTSPAPAPASHSCPPSAHSHTRSRHRISPSNRHGLQFRPRTCSYRVSPAPEARGRPELV